MPSQLTSKIQQVVSGGSLEPQPNAVISFS